VVLLAQWSLQVALEETNSGLHREKYKNQKSKKLELGGAG
jgi:hypothetical protein